MARKGINYEQVAEICENLKSSGQRISVRAIHAHTGGSLSTVLKHYRSWQEEESGGQFKAGISRHLHKALLTELEQTAARVRECHAARLTEAEARTAEGQTRLEAAERRISDLENQLDRTEEALRQARSKLAELENRQANPESELRDQEAFSPATLKTVKPRRKPAAGKKPDKTPAEDEPQLFDF
jgi:septal ring factor EnvC (AmiA/AmiB activator)